MEKPAWALEIDCRNLLKCPLPVMRSRKAIAALAPGQILRMCSDIPGGVKCLPVWSEKSGNPIVRTEQEGGTTIYYIRRGGTL